MRRTGPAWRWAARRWSTRRRALLQLLTVGALAAAGLAVAGLGLTSCARTEAATAPLQAGRRTNGTATARRATTDTPAGGTALPPRANPEDPGTLVTPGANRPDPFVMPVAGGYWLYSSQTGFTTPPISVSFSRNLRRWPAPHAALRTLPPWAVDGFTWAPDVRRIEGRYVMYFDAWAVESLFYEPYLHSLGSHAQCIGTATSRRPGGPFRAQSQPLVCMFDHHGAIDPRTFEAPGGVLWLDWKSDDNANFPTPTAVTHLFAQRLSQNGLGLVGHRFQLIKADRSWENRIVEAPDMVFAHGTYWLFFSGNWFNQPGYAIGVARCRSPHGPCVDYVHPFLASDRLGAGPGEESLFEGSGGRWWMVYSAWFDGYLGRQYRPIALAEVAFGPRGPYLAKS